MPGPRFSQPLYTEHNAMGVVMAEQRHKTSETLVRLAGTKNAISPPLTPCCLLFSTLMRTPLYDSNGLSRLLTVSLSSPLRRKSPRVPRSTCYSFFLVFDLSRVFSLLWYIFFILSSSYSMMYIYKNIQNIQNRVLIIIFNK